MAPTLRPGRQRARARPIAVIGSRLACQAEPGPQYRNH
jgi:hypothetical protein